MLDDLKQVIGGLLRLTAKLVTLPVRLLWRWRKRRKLRAQQQPPPAPQT